MDSVTLALASAPEIDRLVFSVFDVARSRSGDTVATFADQIGRDALFLSVDIGGPLLTTGLTRRQIHLRSRYAVPDDIDRMIDTMQGSGLLVAAGDRLRAAPELAEAVSALIEVRNHAAQELWEGHDVGSASLPAARILAQPPLVADGLLASQVGKGEPAEPSALLAHRLVMMRLLRNDAHAAAWAAHGLTAADMVQLTPRWRGEAPRRPDPDTVASLTARGLVDGDELTAAGRRLRDEVERRTNQVAAPAYEVLGADERAAWLAALRALPGAG